MGILLSTIHKELSTTKEKEARKDYFSVSSVGSCKRALYYDWNGEEGLSYDSLSILRFKTGDKYHQLLVGEMMNMRNVRVCAAEVDIPNEKFGGLFHGRADLIVTVKGENKMRVVDIKSISEYGFKKIVSGQDKKEDHRAQVMFYMTYLGIDNGSLLYINKNKQEMHEIELERDDAFVFKKIEEYRRLLDDFKAGKVPDRLPENHWKCGYCKYRLICR